MRAMLEEDHRDRRQLRHLAAPEPPAGLALILAEPTPAAAARIRIVIDDLIDLVFRQQLAARTLVPGLAARLALTRALGPRLRLRPRLRPALGPRFWQVLGRWLRGVARVLARLLLKPTHPLLEPLTPPGQPLTRPRQPKDHLNATLPPRLVDRLRLRAVHTPKIRGERRRSLL